MRIDCQPGCRCSNQEPWNFNPNQHQIQQPQHFVQQPLHQRYPQHFVEQPKHQRYAQLRLQVLQSGQQAFELQHQHKQQLQIQRKHKVQPGQQTFNKEYSG